MNKRKLCDTLELFTRFQHSLLKYTSIHSNTDSQFLMNSNLSLVLNEINQSPTITKLIINNSNHRDRILFEKIKTKRQLNISNAFENKDIKIQMQRDINASSFNQCSIKTLHLFYHSFNEYILLKEYITSLLFKIIKEIVRIALKNKESKQIFKKNFILAKVNSITNRKMGSTNNINKCLKDKETMTTKVLMTRETSQKQFVTIDEYAKLINVKIRKSQSEVFIRKEDTKQSMNNTIKGKKRPLPLISTTSNYPLDTNANSINVQSILQSKSSNKNFNEQYNSQLRMIIKDQLKNRILTVKKNNTTLTQRVLKAAVSYDYFPLFSSKSRIQNTAKK